MRGEWPAPTSRLLRLAIDPWEHAYLVEIDGSRAIVSSAEPDGEVDTADDVHGE